MALGHQVAMADASQLVSLRYKKQLKTKSVLQVELSNKQADEAFCDFYSQFKTAWAREMDQWVKNLSCKCDGRSSDFSAHTKKKGALLNSGGREGISRNKLPSETSQVWGLGLSERLCLNTQRGG